MMMLENTFHSRTDGDYLHRVAEQITNHPHIASMRNFDEHRYVWTMLPQRSMGGMPDAFPAEDQPARLYLGPFRVELVAAMANPLWSELPHASMAATLH